MGGGGGGRGEVQKKKYLRKGKLNDSLINPKNIHAMA